MLLHPRPDIHDSELEGDIIFVQVRQHTNLRVRRMRRGRGNLTCGSTRCGSILLLLLYTTAEPSERAHSSDRQLPRHRAWLAWHGDLGEWRSEPAAKLGWTALRRAGQHRIARRSEHKGETRQLRSNIDFEQKQSKQARQCAHVPSLLVCDCQIGPLSSQAVSPARSSSLLEFALRISFFCALLFSPSRLQAISATLW